MNPIVAIVGRPNSGKSTLFNRITRSKDALVDDFPGVTRDRNYGHARWDGTEFTLIDTGGFVEDAGDDFASQVRYQIRQAMEDADVIILVLDGKQGVSPFDVDTIQMLRKKAKAVFFLVNKIDGMEKETHMYEFYRLGIEEMFPVSAAHGYGVPDFLDALVQVLPRFDSEAAVAGIQLAIVGRPNVGKSSLINRILGQDRLLVSDIPGTTRDAIDSMCHINDKTYNLIDTAGIRRKGRVSGKLEKFSIIKALRSLARCDVALVLLDTAEGITEQDIHIAGYAYDRGCGIILLLNKWDLVASGTKTFATYLKQLRSEAKFLAFAPAMSVSALTGLRVSKIFKGVDEVYRQYSARIPTGQINRIMEQATNLTQPALYRGRRIKLFYTTQLASKPPTFVSFVNYPQGVHFSYRRYLINQIRSGADLGKTPIRLILRRRNEKIMKVKK